MPIPGRLKKPPLVAAPAVAAEPIPGLPGWVKVRFIGAAVPGAVVVLGGAEKVREPREPELPPPPTRASAEEIAIASGIASERTTAKARTIPRVRCVKFMSLFLNPRHGEAAPKMGRAA
jgi:hypothetical protein